MVKRAAPNARRNGPPSKRQSTSRTQFGPVSAITSAPVAIGNSLRGTKPVVSVTADGCRIQGRDFAFQASATANAVTDWTLIGGLPLTPSVMPTTALRSYAQMYGFFRFNAIAVHYITSSATSQEGDVMFYYERDRTGPGIDTTSSSFLPFVLSDPHTTLGPQWTNHTAIIKPDPEFKSTNYGTNADLNEEANGSVFLFSKTTSANSPGYVIIDYDITFKQLQMNPRAGLLPVSRGQWTSVALAQTGGITVGSLATFSLTGKNTVAGIGSIVPAGTTSGDIYKVVLDVTNSLIVNTAWNGVTPAVLLRTEINGTGSSTQNVNLDDGFTFYITVPDSSATACSAHTTLQSALTSGTTGNLEWSASVVAPNIGLCAFVSLVYSIGTRQQNSY